MQQGYIPVAAASPELVLGDPIQNAENHTRMIEAAVRHEVKLIVFPELSLTGATLGEGFFHRLLREKVLPAILAVAESTRGNDAVVMFGAPLSVEGRLYDCAIAAAGGRILGAVPKTNLGSWDHEQIFASGTEAPTQCVIGEQAVPFGTDLIFQSRQFPDFRLAAELGEDMNALCPPASVHSAAGATVIAELTATRSAPERATEIDLILRQQSARYVCAFVRSDAGNGESVSKGMCMGHLCLAEDGEILQETFDAGDTILAGEVDVQLLAARRERTAAFRCPSGKAYRKVFFDTVAMTPALRRTPPVLPFVWEERSRNGWCDTIIRMQSNAIRRRIEGIGAAAVVILTGGDAASSVAVYSAVRAVKQLGRDSDNVICVVCSGAGQSQARTNRAAFLAETMEATCAEFDVTEAWKLRLKRLGILEESPLAKELANRVRAQVTVDLADQVGGLVLNTDDMTDWAIGQTVSPAGAGVYAVNAGIPKTVMETLIGRIRDLSADNGELHKVLCAIAAEDVGDLAANPNAETERHVRDFCLYYLLRYGFSPNKILRLACRAFSAHMKLPALYSQVETVFRSYLGHRATRANLPDGPRYFDVDLREGSLKSDIFEDLWEEELRSIDPMGPEQEEERAPKEIVDENEDLEEEKERLRKQREALKARAEAQIAMERARESSGTSVVGRRMSDDAIPYVQGKP